MDLLKAKRQAKIDRGKLEAKILPENLNLGLLQRRKKRHGKSRKAKEKKPTKKAMKTKMTLKSHTPNWSFLTFTRMTAATTVESLTNHLRDADLSVLQAAAVPILIQTAALQQVRRRSSTFLPRRSWTKSGCRGTKWKSNFDCKIVSNFNSAVYLGSCIFHSSAELQLVVL